MHARRQVIEAVIDALAFVSPAVPCTRRTRPRSSRRPFTSSSSRSCPARTRRRTATTDSSRSRSRPALLVAAPEPLFDTDWLGTEPKKGDPAGGERQCTARYNILLSYFTPRSDSSQILA